MKYYPEIGITAPDLGWVPAPTYILRRGAILDVIAAWDKGSVLEMGDHDTLMEQQGSYFRMNHLQHCLGESC